VPTKAEKEHLSRVAEIGCIVCRNLGFEETPAQIHHIRSGVGMGQRASHFEVIPLCFVHHSAQSDYGYHHSPATWQQQHGSEKELLQQVMEMVSND